MKINALILNRRFCSIDVPLEDRKYVAALALAKQIAYRLSLPTSPVADVFAWFADNHKSGIEENLYKLNESTVINVSETYELTYKIWKLRYRMVFDVLAVDMITFLDYHYESDNDEVPGVYKTIYEKVGSDKLKSIIREVGFAFEESGE